jgi:hypothetical protein
MKTKTTKKPQSKVAPPLKAPRKKPEVEKPELGREEKLAAYWREKAGLAFSDFDALLGRESPDKISRREPAYDVLQPGVYKKASADEHTIKDLRHVIAHLIAAGFPLSFGEYHLAISFGFLLADGVPYEEFFKTRWHESGEHRAYGPEAACPSCERARKKA